MIIMRTQTGEKDFILKKNKKIEDKILSDKTSEFRYKLSKRGYIIL